MMGGIVGRLFREFAVTLAVAITVSMFVSLSTTPMMCAYMLKEHTVRGPIYMASERAFNWVVSVYGWTLTRVLRHPIVTLLILFGTIGLNGYLFVHVSKGFFPQQDNGRPDRRCPGGSGHVVSVHAERLLQILEIVKADPAIATIDAFTGGGGGATTNTARMFIGLTPLDERKISADMVIARLRPKLARVPGATLYLQASQDLRIGGRMSSAYYQFTMRGDNLQDLTAFGPRMLQALRQIPIITDVSTDQQNNGLQAIVAVRPAHGGALRHLAAVDRQHALRPLRAAAGVHDVHWAESVSRHHGSGAGILAGSPDAARGLRAGAEWAAGSSERHHALRAR